MTTYEQDLHGWAFEQAEKLRAGEPVDVENIAEELESLGKSQRQYLYNRLAILMQHLLKCEFQTERPGWAVAIRVQRLLIAKLLEENPSLRPMIAETIIDAYSTAVAYASLETGIIEQDFPERCPYGEEILETSVK